jgi:hypothetical protein
MDSAPFVGKRKYKSLAMKEHARVHRNINNGANTYIRDLLKEL